MSNDTYAPPQVLWLRSVFDRSVIKKYKEPVLKRVRIMSWDKCHMWLREYVSGKCLQAKFLRCSVQTVYIVDHKRVPCDLDHWHNELKNISNRVLTKTNQHVKSENFEINSSQDNDQYPCLHYYNSDLCDLDLITRRYFSPIG